MNNVETQLQDLRNSVQILADNLTLKGIESSSSDGLTALVAKVQMIGGDGPAVMTLSVREGEDERQGNCYLVKTIGEMNSLTGMEPGQYCLVYSNEEDVITFTNAYIYTDDPDTDEEDYAWRIIDYAVEATAAEVYKGKTFLGASGIEEGYLWTEPTWATSGKVANNVLIKIKNTLEAQTDWSNYLKGGEYEEYKILDMIDSSNVVNFSSMCEGCINLKRLPVFKTSIATNLSNILKGCQALENFNGFAGLGTNFIIEKKRLPEEYTELDSIYANTGNASTPGTQYIDTGIKASSKLKIDMCLNMLNFSYEGTLFGGRSSDTDTFQLDWKTDGDTIWNWGYGTDNKISKGANTNVGGTKLYISTDGNICYIRNSAGTLLQTLTASNTEAFESTQNVWLWSLNNNGSRKGTVRSRYYYFKMWEDDELVRDFVPARNASGIAGFYDLVEGTFYSSIGTAQMQAGSVLPVVYGVEQTDEQTVDLSDCINLSHDSLVNIIENLYNIKSQTTESAKIILGEANLAKLTDAEKAVATNKGWVLE